MPLRSHSLKNQCYITIIVGKQGLNPACTGNIWEHGQHSGRPAGKQPINSLKGDIRLITGNHQPRNLGIGTKSSQNASKGATNTGGILYTRRGRKRRGNLARSGNNDLIESAAQHVDRALNPGLPILYNQVFWSPHTT
jgi:hypothetical protein